MSNSLPQAWFEKRGEASTQWVLEGRDRFIQGIPSTEYRSLMQRKTAGEPTIVLFGPTQVGKTELLLKMMGIDVASPKNRRLKKALRGYRPEGESATATATMYSVHDGEGYIFETPSDWKEGQVMWQGTCLDTLGYQIGGVRKMLDRHQAYSTNPIHITLPNRLVGSGSDLNRLRIIDLPGFGSSDVNEEAQVKALLGRYLPSAMIVVLVFDATRLSEIQSCILKDFADRFPDWGLDNHRYRLVLTRALSPKTIRQDLKPKTEEDLAQHYRSELGAEFPADVRIYPVEYGESWWSLKSNSRKYHSQFEPIFDQMIKGLVTELPESSEIQATLDLQDYWKTLQTLIQKRQSEREVELESLLSQEESIRQKKEDLVSHRDQLEKQNRSLNCPWISNPSIAVTDLSKDTEVCPSLFENHLKSSFSQIETYFSKYTQQLRSHGYNNSVDFPIEVDEIITDQIDELDALDFYLLDSTIREQRNGTLKAVKKAKEIALTELRAHRDKAQDALTQQYEKDVRKRRKAIQALSTQIQSVENQLAAERALIQKHQHDHQNKLQEENESLEYAKRFRTALQAALDTWGHSKANLILKAPSITGEQRVTQALELLMGYQLARSKDLIQ